MYYSTKTQTFSQTKHSLKSSCIVKSNANEVQWWTTRVAIDNEVTMAILSISRSVDYFIFIGISCMRVNL